MYRAIVDLRTWKLIEWLDEPCPYVDWHPPDGGESFTHPDDGPAIERMARDFEEGMPASQVLRLRAPGGVGWTPVNITARVVGLENGLHAGLLAMRHPTDDELAPLPEAAARKGISGKLRARRARAGREPGR